MQLQVTDLVVTRGSRRIIDGLTFEVDAGEALLLTGRNGSGKTTLIRTLAGYLSPLQGKVVLNGLGEDRELHEACHYIGHLNANKASLTVLENLAFWQSYLGGGPPAGRHDLHRDRLWSALEAFEIDPLADFPAGYLSAGQKRRLGLARLLVAERPVWLLDEPTVSLDVQSTALLAQIIDAHVAGGGLVIAATHLPLGLGRTRELRLGARLGRPQQPDPSQPSSTSGERAAPPDSTPGGGDGP